MYASIAHLPNGHAIPQGFAFSGGLLWISQTDAATDVAFVTPYRRRGAVWEQDADPMVVAGSHGWPLHVSGGEVGLLVGDLWKRFPWTPGHARGHVHAQTRIPVSGGLARVTKDKVDRFYEARSGMPLWSRKSPGWVQGEYADDTYLYTFRGSPWRKPETMVPEVPWTCDVALRRTGKHVRTVEVPFPKVGGTRVEIEGAIPGYIGFATGRRMNYGFAVASWSPMD